MRRIGRMAQIGRCVCGKLAYRRRQDAKNAMRALHPDEKGMSAYRCLQGTGTWHFGHSWRKTDPDRLRVVVIEGDGRDNCVCLGSDRTPGCPQHPGVALPGTDAA